MDLKSNCEEDLHKKQKFEIILPLLLKSSTSTISLSMDGGDLFKTLLTVRISVDQPSLWKMITIDAFNNFL